MRGPVSLRSVGGTGAGTGGAARRTRRSRHRARSCRRACTAERTRCAPCAPEWRATLRRRSRLRRAGVATKSRLTDCRVRQPSGRGLRSPEHRRACPGPRRQGRNARQGRARADGQARAGLPQPRLGADRGGLGSRRGQCPAGPPRRDCDGQDLRPRIREQQAQRRPLRSARGHVRAGAARRPGLIGHPVRTWRATFRTANTRATR